MTKKVREDFREQVDSLTYESIEISRGGGDVFQESSVFQEGTACVKASYHTQGLVHRLSDVDGFSLQIGAETNSQGAAHELTTHTPLALPRAHLVTSRPSSAQVKAQRQVGCMHPPSSSC